MAKNTSFYMRIVHRYLGFFLAGIMAVYAISGSVLIFRDTDFLKSVKHIEKTLETGLNTEQLGKEIRMKRFKAEKEDNQMIVFKEGTYNKATGLVKYSKKGLPTILEKMTKLHKATTNSPLYFLNLFFGASLLFFVLSSFWMFMPKTKIFKKGIWFTLGGIALTLLLLFV